MLSSTLSGVRATNYHTSIINLAITIPTSTIIMMITTVTTTIVLQCTILLALDYRRCA